MAQTQKIKLALVGVQKWGAQVAAQMAASEIIDLAWVYDLNADAAEAAASRWNSRAARTLDEALDSDVLGVVVVTPNHTHLEIGCRVARAGKHPMVIKPITNTIAEGHQLLACCREHNVFCAANHPARKSPMARHVKKLIDAGEFGKLILLTNVTGHNGGMNKTPSDWRAQRAAAPGGPLIQLTVHTFDTWQSWLGPIVEVQATGGHRATPGDNDDFFAGQARFADGLLANFATQYASPGASFHAIYGTQRSISQSDRQVIDNYRVEKEGGWPTSEHAVLELEPYNDIRRDVEDFAQDIRAGRQPHASGEEGLRALACVHAAIRSSERNGQWVRVDDVLAER